MILYRCCIPRGFDISPSPTFHNLNQNYEEKAIFLLHDPKSKAIHTIHFELHSVNIPHSVLCPLLKLVFPL